jgi:hypothetical protein
MTAHGHAWLVRHGTTLMSWCAAALIIAAGIGAYASSFGGVFVDVDDQTSIVSNPHIRSLRNPWAAMALPPYTLPRGATAAGRPLLGLSFALTYALCGTAPWGYHLFNLIIHCVAALIVCGIVRRTLCHGRGLGWAPGAATAAAAAVAMLWVVHPLNTQAVTYMVQRAESQMGMLYLLALYCAMRAMQGGGGWWRAGAVAACSMGMLTKQVTVTAPLLIYLYDVIFASGSFRAALRQRRALHVALWATLLLQVPLHIIIADDIHDDFFTTNPLAIAAVNPGVILHYLRLALWPRPLIFAHAWPHRDLLLDIAGPWLLVTAALAWGAWGVWRKRWWGWLMAWFFLILAPTTSIYPNKHMNAVSEHRMYLSLLAVLAVWVLGAAWALRRYGSVVWRVAAWGSLAAVLVVYTGMTRARNEVYHEDDRFWRDSISKQPGHWRLRWEYADKLVRAGRVAAALPQYELVVAQAPHVPQACLAYGRALLAAGAYEAAVTNYLMGAQAGHHADVLYLNAAVAAERAGDTNRAIDYARAAVVCQPSNTAAHIHLRGWYAAVGDTARAAEHAAHAAALLRATLPARPGATP